MRVPLWALLLLFCSAPALGRPWVVAHRGGPRLGSPENLLPTFERAVGLGVDGIEMDIHQSSDGGLIVIHDDTLDRTFGRTGTVADMTLAELQSAGVPTLQEVIDIAKGKCRLIVEIKHPDEAARYDGIEQRLLDILRANDVLQDTVVICFEKRSIEILSELAPELPTGYLTSDKEEPHVAKDLGAAYFCPKHKLVDAGVVRQAHELGLKVSVWTANSERDMQAMIDAGCDAITTDDPALLKKLLGL